MIGKELRMSSKKISSLKKGNTVQAAINNEDHSIAYVGWCKIVETTKIRVWSNVKSTLEDLIEVTFEALGGKMKGDNFKRIFRESDKLKVPKEPWRIVKAFRVLFCK